MDTDTRGKPIYHLAITADKPVDQFYLEYLRFFILNTQAWNELFILELYFWSSNKNQ